MKKTLQLQRHPANPILKPNPLHDWEALNVFNCAVVHHQGLFHMLYRAQGVDYVSTIGYAVSADGVSFNRLERPVLTPADELETWGVEDPRVTEIEDQFIMAYTAYSPRGITPMFARSTNLVTWERIGPLVTGEDNKDHVLFPRRVKGRYVAFHRRPPGMWLAYSDDLKTWKDFQPFMGPREDNWWDCNRIGAGGVPTTSTGWVCACCIWRTQRTSSTAPPSRFSSHRSRGSSKATCPTWFFRTPTRWWMARSMSTTAAPTA